MKIFFLILFLIAALGITGAMDYDDQVEQQRVYCENVAGGVWPDYKGNAAEVCK